MVSDSIINASISGSSKDFGKKKRANRSAKLKQCKLDARRQQWLSQVNVEGQKAEVSGNGSRNRDFNAPEIEVKKGKKKGKDRCEARSVSVNVNVNVNMEQIHIHDSDSEESLLANSPTGSVNGSGNGYTGSSGSSTSSRSSASSVSFGSGGWCCSGSITEEEEGRGCEFGGDDGCLDDWETVADALVGTETHDKENDSRDDVADADQEHGDRTVDAHAEKGILGRGGVNRKAWRPDDAFRPQSLPNLSSQLRFPANMERRLSHFPPVPSSCPICCEDLDFTDSSFLPCPCGFHLCLFCHKRILEEDGRCPGCRKPYPSEVVEKETSVSGGSLTIRLGRSCSMFSRV